MPAYDFTCTSCGRTFERRLSMSAYAEGQGRVCPECGSRDVERAWTGCNVIAGRSKSAPSAPACGPSGFT